MPSLSRAEKSEKSTHRCFLLFRRASRTPCIVRDVSTSQSSPTHINSKLINCDICLILFGSMGNERLILCSVQKCRLLSHSWRLLISLPCTSSFCYLVFLLNFSLNSHTISQRHWVLETQFWFQALNWPFHLFLRLPINSFLWEPMHVTFYGPWFLPCSAYCLQSNQSFLLYQMSPSP